MEIRYFYGKAKLSDKEKSYIEQKISKMDKFLTQESPKEVKVSVEVDQDRHGFWTVAVAVSTSKKTFRTRKNDSDLLKVIDIMKEALMKQIRRDNERVRDTVRNRKRR